MSYNNKLIRVDVIDLEHTDDELQQMSTQQTDAIEEAKALKEMDNLFFEMTEIMHDILNLEQKHGFLTKGQHDKIFVDINDYGGIRVDVTLRNTPKPPNKSSKSTSPITFNNDTDDGDDDLYIKTTPRKKATNFSFEMF